MDRLVSVNPLRQYLIELEFAGGLKKIVDMRPFIGKGLSAALKDESYFNRVAVESGGGIYWPNGYDFCPNFLRDEVAAVSPILA